MYQLHTRTVAGAGNAVTTHGLEERAVSVNNIVVLGVERLQLVNTVLDELLLYVRSKVFKLGKPEVLVV